MCARLQRAPNNKRRRCRVLHCTGANQTSGELGKRDFLFPSALPHTSVYALGHQQWLTAAAHACCAPKQLHRLLRVLADTAANVQPRDLFCTLIFNTLCTHVSFEGQDEKEKERERERLDYSTKPKGCNCSVQRKGCSRHWHLKNAPRSIYWHKVMAGNVKRPEASEAPLTALVGKSFFVVELVQK